MVWQIVKEGAFLLLAFLDAEFTKRRLAATGIEIELNPVVRLCCKLFGLNRGVDMGVAIPAFVLAAVGWYHPELLAFLLGIRTFLFLLQCRARQYANESKDS